MRHAELLVYVKERVCDEAGYLVLTQPGERKLGELLTQLTQFDHVTQKLQRHNATLRILSAYFDATLKEFPSLHNRLTGRTHCK